MIRQFEKVICYFSHPPHFSFEISNVKHHTPSQNGSAVPALVTYKMMVMPYEVFLE